MKLRDLIVFLIIATLGILSAAITIPARGAYVLTLEQTAGEVIASGNGSFNLAALTLFESGLAGYVATIQPNAGYIVVGVASPDVDLYNGMSGPATIGPGEGAQENANSASGSATGGIAGEFLVVPAGYTSGTILSGSAEWTDATLSSLGVTPGTYTFTWGSGPTADSFTLNATVGAVPEASSWAMLLSGAGMLVYFRSRRGRLSGGARFGREMLMHHKPAYRGAVPG